jgi:hypothetical protein
LLFKKLCFLLPSHLVIPKNGLPQTLRHGRFPQRIFKGSEPAGIFRGSTSNGTLNP